MGLVASSIVAGLVNVLSMVGTTAATLMTDEIYTAVNRGKIKSLGKLLPKVYKIISSNNQAISELDNTIASIRAADYSKYGIDRSKLEEARSKALSAVKAKKLDYTARGMMLDSAASAIENARSNPTTSTVNAAKQAYNQVETTIQGGNY